MTGSVSHVSRPGDLPLPTWQRLAGTWLHRARVGALALACMIEALTLGASVRTGAAVTLALTYALLRRRIDDGSDAAWMDAATAAVLVALTGGITSPYAAFGLVASIQAGVLLGPRGGGAVGALIALSGSFALFAPQADISQQFAWLALFPLSGVTGALLARVLGDDGHDLVRMLRQTNVLLRDVHAITSSVPTGFDARQIVQGAVARVHHLTGADATYLVLFTPADAVVAASQGRDARARSLDLEVARRMVDGSTGMTLIDDLPGEIAASLGFAGGWFVVPLARDDHVDGFITFRAGRGGGEIAAREIERVAAHAAMTLDNARLLHGLRDLVADDERRRLARDLHDGVAQSLSHLRLDLELLGREAVPFDEGVAAHMTRLTGVVETCLDEIRGMIRGLRTTAGHDGLVGSIREHLRQSRPLVGPDIRFEARVEPALPDRIEHEVLRITQEAIANARRHSGAQHIDVTLDLDGGELCLRVTDDGRGRGPTTGEASNAAGGGYGTRFMIERASEIGGALLIADADGGGTQVELRLPLTPVTTPADSSIPRSGRPIDVREGST